MSGAALGNARPLEAIQIALESNRVEFIRSPENRIGVRLVSKKIFLRNELSANKNG
jgi:hypothetical protein